MNVTVKQAYNQGLTNKGELRDSEERLIGRLEQFEQTLAYMATFAEAGHRPIFPKATDSLSFAPYVDPSTQSLLTRVEALEKELAELRRFVSEGNP